MRNSQIAMGTLTLFCAATLSAVTVCAQTNSGAHDAIQEPPVNSHFSVVKTVPGSEAPKAAVPLTNLDPTPQSAAQRRQALQGEIDRLQREYDQLQAVKGDPSSETMGQIHKDASARLRKINKMKSELLNLPAQLD